MRWSYLLVFTASNRVQVRPYDEGEYFLLQHRGATRVVSDDLDGVLQEYRSSGYTVTYG